MKLFYLPCAGGNSAYVNRWKRYLDNNIEIIGIDVPLSNTNSNLKEYNTIYYKAQKALYMIKKNISSKDEYCIFAHSMGCWVLIELLYYLKQLGLKMPSWVFLSGNKPPYIEEKSINRISLLDDNEFIEYLKRLGGIPECIADNKDLLKLYLPSLRRDFKAIEEYHFNHDICKFDINAAYLCASDDIISEDLVIQWKNIFDYFIIDKFFGNHFFLYYQPEKVSKYINEKINNMNKIERKTSKLCAQIYLK